VGDSLANVALGYASTQPLSLEAMIHHCQAVMRGLTAPLFSATFPVDVPRPPLVIADMPFGTTMASRDAGVAAVVKLMQQTAIDGVKIEGAHEVVPLIQTLAEQGVPVMGHLGLQPQRVGATSGYRVQAQSAAEAKALYDAAVALQRAGCFALVLECIPTRVAEFITQRLRIPTIGIGAGSKTDGQILVMNDMLADLTNPAHVLAALHPASPASPASAHAPAPSPLNPPMPKFVRSFTAPTSLGSLRIAAVQAYTHAVRNRTFPNDQVEGYKIKSDEWRRFLQIADSA
jgi:3-methyl-2-oxobutanoate hydroxymethyltransferase